MQKLKAKTKIAIKFYFRLISGYSTFFIIIFLFSFLLNKTLESAFVIFGYFGTRFVVPKIKHFNTSQKCITVTILTFIFSIGVLCISKHLSLIWSGCVGTCLPLIMYAESLLFDKKYDYNQLVEFFETNTICKKFSVDNCTQDELIERCKQINLSDLNTKLAVEFFIKKTKQSILADKLCVNENSVSKRKQRLKQKLNNI